MSTRPQHYCLKWNNYQSHVAEVFTQLLQAESMVDVTLCAEGHKIHAHRIVLSACSPYFQVCWSILTFLLKINLWCFVLQIFHLWLAVWLLVMPLFPGLPQWLPQSYIYLTVNCIASLIFIHPVYWFQTGEQSTLPHKLRCRAHSHTHILLIM